jgi:DNA-binding CsgD family transcriptional regulator
MVDGAGDAALARLEDVVTALPLAEGPAFAEFAVMLAEVRVTTGDVDRARAELSVLPVAHVGAALAMAAIDRLDGDLARAETLVLESLPTAVRNAVLLVPDALELLAGIAAEQESAVEAARLFGAASSLRDATGLVRFPVRQAGYDADVTMAREHLGADEFDTAWQQGAALTMDEAVELARRGRGERRRPSTGWASLTPTERRVVPLVAEHLTNAEIGARLFMSPTTVKTHLSHIFAKLGVSSRAQLASAAIRKGLA